MPPNWKLIEKCPVWPTLGVTECNNCEHLVECWGEETQLPEPSKEGLKQLQKILNEKNDE